MGGIGIIQYITSTGSHDDSCTLLSKQKWYTIPIFPQASDFLGVALKTK